jgi:hypothetical protein
LETAAATTNAAVNTPDMKPIFDGPFRIRKKRGRRGIVTVDPFETKKIRTINTDEPQQHKPRQQQTVNNATSTIKTKTLAEQCADPSYCCISGDAGPTSPLGTVSDDLDDNDAVASSDQSLAALAMFAKSRLADSITTSSTTPAKTTDASASLLGKFRRKNVMQ